MIRLLVIQYAGDYREAFNRFSVGGEETYYGQRRSVEGVGNLAQKIDEVAVMCCLSEEFYNEILDNKVRAIGAGFKKKIQIRKLLMIVEAYKPTHLILCTPIRPILSWAIRKKVKTLVSLADSFSSKSLRNKISNYLLANLLNNHQIDWIGNHGTTASISLAKIGVNPDKIIPWDYSHEITPNAFSPKNKLADRDIKEIIYVGTISESKGVGDTLEAIAQLKSKGLSIKLKIAGKGDTESFLIKANHLQIEDCVEFLGLVPNKTIISLMREADIVVVPSRHEYPEGFPMTIYEALCSRTPIIASDHPMFCKKLDHQINALIFSASNPSALALCIENLLSDRDLYQRLSFAASKTWESLPG